MNTATLCMVLDSISSDSSKNTSLKKLINTINDFTWDILSKVVKCYSSDSSKTDAVKTIINSDVCSVFIKNTNQPMTITQICNVLSNISSDSSKSTAFGYLSGVLERSNGNGLCYILQTISSDSTKDNVTKNWIGTGKNSVTLEQLVSILKVVSSDSSKSSIAKNTMKCFHSGQTSTLGELIGCISSDSSKVNIFESVLDALVKKTPGLQIGCNDIVFVLKKISSDSSTVNILEKIKTENALNNIKFHELLCLTKEVSSESSKVNIVGLFDGKYDNYSFQDNANAFCEKLCDQMKYKKYFHQICETLKIDKEVYSTYEEKLADMKDFNITVNNGYDDFNGVGYGGYSKQTIQVENKRTTIIKQGNSISTTIEYF